MTTLGSRQPPHHLRLVVAAHRDLAERDGVGLAVAHCRIRRRPTPAAASRTPCSAPRAARRNSPCRRSRCIPCAATSRHCRRRPCRCGCRCRAAAASRSPRSARSIASRISRAAVTARCPASGSSSGAPNSARKPSPRNLFTMPPLRSTISTSTSKARSSRCTTSSGVRCRAAAVKLRISTNITATSCASVASSAPALSSRSTTCGETCWPNRLVTRSRAVAAAMLATNCRRSCAPTAPASTPPPSSTTLRDRWKPKSCPRIVGRAVIGRKEHRHQRTTRPPRQSP